MSEEKSSISKRELKAIWKGIIRVSTSLLNLYQVENPLQILKIDLSFNQITHLSQNEYPIPIEDSYSNPARDLLFLCTNLRELHVKQNNVTSFPISLSYYLPSLTELNLSENRLTEIPESMSLLTSLVILSLSDNYIPYLPSSFLFPQLQVLHLGNNCLQQIPLCISTFSSLLQLDLSSNLLSSVSLQNSSAEPLTETWCSSTIRSLYIENNFLSSIPLHHLLSIERLSLSSNNINFIPPYLLNTLSSFSLSSLPSNISSLLSEFLPLSEDSDLGMTNSLSLSKKTLSLCLSLPLIKSISMAFNDIDDFQVENFLPSSPEESLNQISNNNEFFEQAEISLFVGGNIFDTYKLTQQLFKKENLNCTIVINNNNNENKSLFSFNYLKGFFNNQNSESQTKEIRTYLIKNEICRIIDLSKITSSVKLNIEDEKNENKNEIYNKSNEREKEKIIVLKKRVTLHLSLNSPQCDEILSGLFLGSLNSARNKHYLISRKISHILIVATEIRPNYPSLFVYKKIFIQDSISSDILSTFDECHQFIDSVLDPKFSSLSTTPTMMATDQPINIEGRKGVLVHCAAGKSRSASVIISYLMRKKHWKFNKAFDYVKKRRPEIGPNPSFLNQLKSFEEILFQKQKKEKKN